MKKLIKITSKKVIPVVLILAIMASMLNKSSASAASAYQGRNYTSSPVMAHRLDALFSAYEPNKSYFKSTPSGNNRNGDNSTPCQMGPDGRGGYVGSSVTCGRHDDGRQCLGYALYAQYVLFGKSESAVASLNPAVQDAHKVKYTTVANPTKAQIMNMPLGTHLRFLGFRHSMILLKATESTITFLDCNCAWSNCGIHLHTDSWWYFFAKLGVTSAVSPGYASYPTSETYPNLMPTPEPTPTPQPYGSTPFIDISNHWAKNSIEKAYSKSMVSGISANKFDPNGSISRAMFVQILYNMANKPKTKGFGFSDVPSGAWYYKAVSWAANNKIVSGTGNNKFSPDALITREQAAVILYNYLYLSKSEKPKPYPIDSLSKFEDSFGLSRWAIRAMAWAVDTGLIKGQTRTTVAPSAIITRGEAVVLLLRVKL
jgi:S-layer homology domain.